MKPEDIKLTPDLFRQQAEHRVALGLVVGELVRPRTCRRSPSR